jgi:predicted phosphodiesterase
MVTPYQNFLNLASRRTANQSNGHSHRSIANDEMVNPGFVSQCRKTEKAKTSLPE